MEALYAIPKQECKLQAYSNVWVFKNFFFTISVENCLHTKCIFFNVTGAVTQLDLRYSLQEQFRQRIPKMRKSFLASWFAKAESVNIAYFYKLLRNAVSDVVCYITDSSSLL